MRCRFLLPLFALCFLQASAAPVEVDEILKARKKWENKIWRSEVAATWEGDGTHFWYKVQTGPKAYEYVRVNAVTGERKAGPDRASIGLPEMEFRQTSRSTEKPLPSLNGGAPVKVMFQNRMTEPVQMVWVNAEGKHQSFSLIPPGGEFSQNTFSGHVWLVQDREGKRLAAVTASREPLRVEIDGPSLELTRRAPMGKRGVGSPNGQWSVWVEKGKVVLRDNRAGRSQIVKTGLEDKTPFTGGIAWAPNSSCFVVSCAAETSRRRLKMVESSPADQVQPRMKEVDYVKPGDPLPQPRPVIFRPGRDGCTHQEVSADLFPNAFLQADRLEVRWAPDGSEFYFDYNQRGHQLYRILAVDARTGATRTVVEETSQTFIDYTQKTWRHWLDRTGEVLWMSERDGWCHLWLYDSREGHVKQQVTKGTWVLRQVEHVDETARRVWFMASGVRAGEDPYHQHLCSIGLDGTGFRQLTEGEGQHRISWSPDKKFFIATWSRVDHPAVTELRSSDDGHLVAQLETADVSALLATGWQMPERFVAKGRDGKTDIHGVLFKPAKFDPARKYSVLEQIYAGPHGSFVPREFGVHVRQHEMTEAGFVLVQADGMGTNHRGKAFHEVCWKNLKDAGFPDRMAWIRAAAQTRPWMDLSRMGIYGGSAGGQSALRALLDHGNFYKAAVADCGCHDNRMDKIWWNEQWLGWPVDESYKKNSNVEDAARLQGRLLLIVGELDTNVDPSSTYQVVSALQKAGKSFEYMPIMGTGHSAAETPYGNRLRLEFLMRQLLGPATSSAPSE
ncbi:MAG TPA: prolyl oligopeptidase family serine peptidase [Prosthecobacter sp.]